MVSIRRIQIGEGELFKTIRLTALRESPFAFGSTYESALKRSSASWREQADSTAQGSDRSTFIAFANDSPVGIAALYRDKEREEIGELLQVWVSPDYRGKGIATELLDAVFHWAGENGFRTVRASVAKINKRALRFYRRYGFELAAGGSLGRSDDFVLLKKIEAKPDCGMSKDNVAKHY